MLFGEVIAHYSRKHTKNTISLCEQMRAANFKQVMLSFEGLIGSPVYDMTYLLTATG